MNRYAIEEPPPRGLHRQDAEVEREQVERVRAVRASRDAARHAAAIDRLRRTAREDGNLLPAILESVKALAPVGEISFALRSVFGEHRDAAVL